MDGKVHFMDSPGYAGDKTLHLNIALIMCTTVVVGLRLYVRAFMSKALGPDDLLAFVAFGLVTALSAMDIRLVQFGSGAHIEYVPKSLLATWFESLTTQTLIYFVGTGMMRLSIVAFLPRLSQDRTYLILVYITGFFVVSQTVGCFFYRLTECSPIADIWKPPFLPGLNCVLPEAENTMMVVHQVIGLILDISLMGLPIWVVYTKMIFSQRAFQVILVFSVGLFVIVTGCIRLVMLKTLLFLADPTFNMSTIGVWTDLEGHIGLWVASFPALQPLVRIISYKFGFRSKLQSYGKEGHTDTCGGASRSRSRAWAGPARSRGHVRNGSGFDATDSHSERGIISNADKDVELDKMDNRTSGIHKQVDVEVRVDNAPGMGKPVAHTLDKGFKSWLAI
ncbi:hypothetical protein HER10_EVM0005471 [Colletotrichum scovillei]|uniref:Integral membrane protein n=1 Tax=Colletotrichum scovillei TaxID=1209932 RepID=A0A9P7R342_9PEZI|nr:uncharacterized protein HER10_EVM0005471 [Colletotrichum scovillei]KAF4776352.1 hypothetical protein HER10_EVM0005471 [Colletotrichum scovillei]KAG7047339.1 integral membrane protein [Colletotrichum scovillei]KAG7059691.1 integral membrane protein [Colletotrichum scovillei]KAG7067105.1 integral membrane protein [Colletotrichum scovillei]